MQLRERTSAFSELHCHRDVCRGCMLGKSLAVLPLLV